MSKKEKKGRAGEGKRKMQLKSTGTSAIPYAPSPLMLFHLRLRSVMVVFVSNVEARAWAPLLPHSVYERLRWTRDLFDAMAIAMASTPWSFSLFLDKSKWTSTHFEWLIHFSSGSSKTTRIWAIKIVQVEYICHIGSPTLPAITKKHQNTNEQMAVFVKSSISTKQQHRLKKSNSNERRRGSKICNIGELLTAGGHKIILQRYSYD